MSLWITRPRQRWTLEVDEVDILSTSTPKNGLPKLSTCDTYSVKRYVFVIFRGRPGVFAQKGGQSVHLKCPPLSALWITRAVRYA